MRRWMAVLVRIDSVVACLRWRSKWRGKELQIGIVLFDEDPDINIEAGGNEDDGKSPAMSKRISQVLGLGVNPAPITTDRS